MKLVSREGGTVGYPMQILGVWVPSMFHLRHRKSVIAGRWRCAWKLATGQLSFGDAHSACQLIDSAWRSEQRRLNRTEHEL